MDIKEQIDYLKDRLEDIKIDYQNKRSRINREIKSIQNSCDHDSITYHPDPSGNNDSSYVCDECGLEKKRFK